MVPSQIGREGGSRRVEALIMIGLVYVLVFGMLCHWIGTEKGYSPERYSF